VALGNGCEWKWSERELLTCEMSCIPNQLLTLVICSYIFGGCKITMVKAWTFLNLINKILWIEMAWVIKLLVKLPVWRSANFVSDPITSNGQLGNKLLDILVGKQYIQWSVFTLRTKTKATYPSASILHKQYREWVWRRPLKTKPSGETKLQVLRVATHCEENI